MAPTRPPSMGRAEAKAWKYAPLPSTTPSAPVANAATPVAASFVPPYGALPSAAIPTHTADAAPAATIPTGPPPSVGASAYPPTPAFPGYVPTSPAKLPSLLKSTTKISEHDQSIGDRRAAVKIKKSVQLFDLPQELVDNIMDFAYPEEDLSKFITKREWDEKEMELKRMNVEYERKPLPSQKVTEFLVSKKFFECATAAWIGNQEFITAGCRHAGNRRNIFEYLGTAIVPMAFVERLCKKLTTHFPDRYILNPSWDRLPSLSRLTLVTGTRTFEVLEPHFAWEYALTDRELKTVVANSRQFRKLSGLTEFVLLPDDIKYVKSKRQKDVWEDNIKALETMLRRFVLSPLALRKLSPQDTMDFNEAAIAKDAQEGVTKNDLKRRRPVTAVGDDSQTPETSTSKAPANETGASTATAPSMEKVPMVARDKTHHAKAKPIDFTKLVVNGKVFNFAAKNSRGQTGSTPVQGVRLKSRSKPELTLSMSSIDEQGGKKRAFDFSGHGARSTTYRFAANANAQNLFGSPLARRPVAEPQASIAAATGSSAKGPQPAKSVDISRLPFSASLAPSSSANVAKSSKEKRAVNFAELVSKGEVFPFRANASGQSNDLSKSRPPTIGSPRISHAAQTLVGSQSEHGKAFEFSAANISSQSGSRASYKSSHAQDLPSFRDTAHLRRLYLRDVRRRVKLALKRSQTRTGGIVNQKSGKRTEKKAGSDVNMEAKADLADGSVKQALSTHRGRDEPPLYLEARFEKSMTLASAHDASAKSGEDLRTEDNGNPAHESNSGPAEVVTEPESAHGPTKCHPDQWVSQGKKNKSRN